MVAALSMVVMRPSRTLVVPVPVNPPGRPDEMPVGGPVVGVGAVMACEYLVRMEARLADPAASVGCWKGETGLALAAPGVNCAVTPVDRPPSPSGTVATGAPVPTKGS